MENYERMYWSLTSNLDAATARQNELVSAQSVKVFDKIFPAFPKMLSEKKALISSYEGNVPLDIQEQFAEKYKDLFAQTDAFWDELRELSSVLPELRAKAEERKEQEEKAKKEEWKRIAYHGFLSKSTMMAAVRSDKALQKMVNFGPDGGVMTVAAFVERHHAAGTLDAKAKAEKPSIDRRRWNRMTAEQQSDWERQHQKSVMRYSVNRYGLGKTAYDYAVYLSNIKK